MVPVQVQLSPLPRVKQNVPLLNVTSGALTDDIEKVVMDHVQGQVGDCWFLSTLSSIARTDPGLIEQDIVSLGNDQYKVCFNEIVNNAPQADWITIDGKLPEESDGSLPFAQVPSDGAPKLCRTGRRYLPSSLVAPSLTMPMGISGRA